MANTIDRFKEGLKAMLRDNQSSWHSYERDTEGGYHVIDWPWLDKAIDEFAAEFQRDSKPPR